MTLDGHWLGDQKKIAVRRVAFKHERRPSEGLFAMFLDHRFPTAYGSALVSEPRGLTIPHDPVAALAFAVQRDREADRMLAEGRFLQAERLSHAALEARARATGERA